jgi:hypothetical protein
MPWELLHALTMVPGLFITHAQTNRLIAYKVFCICSIFYHSLRLASSNSKYILIFMRIDFLSQQIACWFNSNNTWSTLLLSIIAIGSLRIDISNEKGRLIHKIMNGASIIITSLGYSYVSTFYWFTVIACAILFQTTRYNIFHSLMHLCGHIAYSTCR